MCALEHVPKVNQGRAFVQVRAVQKLPIADERMHLNNVSVLSFACEG